MGILILKVLASPKQNVVSPGFSHKTFLSTLSTKFVLETRENSNPAVLIGGFSSMSTKTVLKIL